ncbi:MAG: hypothetical protein KF753_04940 [Caldilineaceae bacterium]|nr:hypothetical protein [Caldilineaceae bacterium]
MKIYDMLTAYGRALARSVDPHASAATKERLHAEMTIMEDEAQAIGALIAATSDLLKALQPLAAIANAYDRNELDGEARKFWGLNDEHQNNKQPAGIELYQGRGGKQLLTLADCFAARAAIASAKESTQ